MCCDSRGRKESDTHGMNHLRLGCKNSKDGNWSGNAPGSEMNMATPTLLRAFLTHVPITQGQRTGGLVPPVATRGPLVMAVGSRCVGAFYLGAGSGE